MVISWSKTKVKSQKYWTPRKIQNGKFLIKWQNQMIKHIKRIWSWGNDDSPSEKDDKWLTRDKREPYILHVKDILVDFEKEHANASTRQHSHQQSGKGLLWVAKRVS